MSRHTKIGILTVSAVVAGAGALGLLVVGFIERALFVQGSETPQQVRAAELIARGLDGNIHLEITDFRLGSNYVYDEKNGSRTCVWIPVFPAGESDGPVRVVLRSSQHLDDEDLAALEEQPSMQGVVTNSVAGLSREERDRLAAQYPGSDMDTALLFNVGRSFPSARKVYGLLGGGAALVALALGLGVYAWLVNQPTVSDPA